MLIKSDITPFQTLNQLASKYGVFGFLLRNITQPGKHFAARCYLSALDDAGTLQPGEIFQLLQFLDSWHLVSKAELNASSGGAQRRPEEAFKTGSKKLYLSVTRKVSPVDRKNSPSLPCKVSLTGETFTSI